MKQNWKRSGLIYIIIFAVAIALVSLVVPPPEKPKEIPLSEAIAMSQNNEIDKVLIDDDTLLITTVTGEELKTATGNLTVVDLQDLGFKLPEGGYEVDTSGGFDWGLMLTFLPLIVFGALLFFLFRRAQGANNQAFSFGRSKARMFSVDRPKVTFDDVAGVEEAKQEVEEVVDFLRSR